MLRLTLISCFSLLAIAGCSKGSPVDSEAEGNAALPQISAPAPSATGEPHGETVRASSLPRAVAAIPTSLQGRWALAPSDCNVPAELAKGLLIVRREILQFYRSSAVPASYVGVDETSIGGNFAFVGSGRSWTKYEALKFANDRLTRTEINPTASFSYAKCS